MLTEKSKLWEFMKDAPTRRVILNRIPELTSQPNLTFVFKNMTLEQYAQSSIDRLDQAWIDDVLKEATIAANSPPPVESVPSPEETLYHDRDGESGSAALRGPTTVRLWDIGELEMDGPADGNPFVQVRLSAIWTKGHRRIQTVGFYDGNGKYRIRFMPDELGEWTFETNSSVRSMHGITGKFECVEPASGNHGLVRVKNTYHFAYDDGTPYRPFGTTCYAWTHQSRELEIETLESLRTSPFNKIRMCVFPKAYLYNENEPPMYPFEGSPEEGFDYRRPNPTFFQHLERRIADLAELGIEADLILFHPYDRWGFAEMKPEEDDRYLRYVVARLSAHRNVWWSLANEYDLMWAKTPEDWERYARIINELDPARHLISNHNCLTFYDYNKEWVTHCSIQRIDVYKTSEATNEWRERWRKPIVIDECAYEGNIDQGWGNISGEEMVRRFWEGTVRGGYVGHGETYMHPQDVLWWAKGGKLHGTSPERIAFLRKILEEGPRDGLEPLRSAWDVPCAGVEDEYYLYYFGFSQPTFREFRHKKGVQYFVDVIDTWNMTETRMAGTFEGVFRIELPGRPYMAVRMTKA